MLIRARVICGDTMPGMRRVALLLVAVSLATLTSAAKSKRTPDPPTVAEHIDWQRHNRDGRVPRRQLVGLLGEDGMVSWTSRPMPRAGRKGEAFHVRVIRPSYEGMAYYAWKTDKLEAFTNGSGRLVVRPVRRRSWMWRLFS